MRRFARLTKAGVVSEFFDRDPTGLAHPDVVSECVACDDDDALVGASFNAGTFTNPAPGPKIPRKLLLEHLADMEADTSLPTKIRQLANLLGRAL